MNEELKHKLLNTVGIELKSKGIKPIDWNLVK